MVAMLANTVSLASIGRELARSIVAYGSEGPEGGAKAANVMQVLLHLRVRGKGV